MLITIGVTVSINLYYQIHSDDIKFTIADTLPQSNGQAAKVILLGGQSNAVGCSLNEYLQNNVSAEKYSEYQNGYDNIYINYYCSDHNISGGFVKTSINQGENTECFGPEVGLAEKLHEQYPDEIFFIIKCAWSATDLFEQWLSPTSYGLTGKLYHNFVRYVRQNMEYLQSKGYKPQIEAMCWMQGESDSFFVSHATNYKSNLKNLIYDIRKDCKSYAADDGIAFVDAYIADNPNYWVHCDLVNQSKQAVADADDNTVVIDTNAHGLACNQEPADTPDMAHYDSLSQIELGHLFAEQVANFLI